MNESSRLVAWGAELRAVHHRLREALRVARRAVDDGEPDSAGADLLLFCRGFCAALDGHHRGEDRQLFPRVLAHRLDLAPVIAKLSQDHSMIDYLLSGLEQAVSAGQGAAVAHRHLDGIEAVMETHFRYEERELLSVLDSMDDDAEPGELLGPLAG